MEQESLGRGIFYNRAGILSTTTQVDQVKADQFMRVADMRRDIIFTDSDQKPERNAVAVSSDTLPLEVLNQ